WVHAGVDRYFVARDEGAVTLRAMDGTAADVEVTGIPIDPCFSRPADRTDLRRKHGVPTDGPVVLLLGGGFGGGPVEGLFARRQDARRPARIVVVAGRHEKLQRALRAAAGPRAVVLGLTPGSDGGQGG